MLIFHGYVGSPEGISSLWLGFLCLGVRFTKKCDASRFKVPSLSLSISLSYIHTISHFFLRVKPAVEPPVHDVETQRWGHILTGHLAYLGLSQNMVFDPKYGHFKRKSSYVLRHWIWQSEILRLPCQNWLWYVWERMVTLPQFWSWTAHLQTGKTSHAL